jgi:hypothetical protein
VVFGPQFCFYFSFCPGRRVVSPQLAYFFPGCGGYLKHHLHFDFAIFRVARRIAVFLVSCLMGSFKTEQTQ